MGQNNTIGSKLKFQDLPGVPDNQKLTAIEFNQLPAFQKSPVQQIAGSLDDTDIIIDGTKNYGTTIVVAGATRTITANASGHLQGNNIKQRYTFNVDCTITLSGFDTPGNNTGKIDPILAGTYDFIYLSNRNGVNLLILKNINVWIKNGDDIFFNTGNVGIGTNNPQSKLHLTSTEISNAVQRVENSLGNIIHTLAEDGTSDGVSTIRKSDGTTTISFNSNGDSYFNGGNLGIGTETPQNKADVAGGMAVGLAYAGIMTAPTDGLLVEGDSGFGTAAPQRKMDIVGPAGVTNGIQYRTSGTSLLIGEVFNKASLFVGSGKEVTLFGGGAVAIRIYTNQFVSVGTGVPATRLHVNGAITQNELSTDPADPAEGQSVTWQSDGTGTGDDGDIMMKIRAGGVTKTTTLVDFSAI